MHMDLRLMLEENNNCYYREYALSTLCQALRQAIYIDSLILFSQLPTIVIIFIPHFTNKKNELQVTLLLSSRVKI